MSNPFEAPEATAATAARDAGAGTLSLRTTLRETLAALARQPLEHAVVGVAYVAAFAFSVLACFLPVLVVAPILTWGLARYALRSFDRGDAPVGELFSGAQVAGESWLAAVSAWLLNLAGSVVGVAVQVALTVMTMMVVGVIGFASEDAGAAVGVLLAILRLPLDLAVILGMAFVSTGSRLVLLWHVDRAVPVFDAVRAAWPSLRANWWRVALLPLAVMLPFLVPLVPIFSVAAVGMIATSGSGEALPGLLLLGAGVTSIPFFLAFLLGTELAMASGYRQLFGPVDAGRGVP